MYTETDRQTTQRAAKRAHFAAGLFLFLGLLITVAGLIFRVRALAVLGLGVGGCAAYFYYSLKAGPRVRYARFLREIETGLSRKTRVIFEELSAASRVTEEGVSVFDLAARDEDGETRLFYFDAAKPLPTLQPGQSVDLTAYGRYVVDWLVV